MACDNGKGFNILEGLNWGLALVIGVPLFEPWVWIIPTAVFFAGGLVPLPRARVALSLTLVFAIALFVLEASTTASGLPNECIWP
jgi:hypothetical protein